MPSMLLLIMVQTCTFPEPIVILRMMIWRDVVDAIVYIVILSF
jgi:hypothetical protein